MDETLVDELMTEPVLTVNSADQVGAVGRAMLNQEIKSVVVIDGDCQPEGILTSTDFVAIATDGPDAIDAEVAEWMTTDIHTVSTDEPVADAADLMLAENISHLPVVDDDGAVVGILSMTDIVGDRATPAATN